MSVEGVAGAARIEQLDLTGLAAAEKHGKRQDKVSEVRCISDDPPVTTTGLELRQLYDAHVADAFVPKASKRCHHMIVQFPMELVDGESADFMVKHARAFAEQVFGEGSVFADRCDRDEKSRHVVDLFIAPKYTKKTKHTEKLAIGMTKHLPKLAKKYGRAEHQIGMGQALQDAVFEYFRDEMKLEGVQRGEEKTQPGRDQKSAEQLRMDELDREERNLKDLKRAVDEQQRTINEREAKLKVQEKEARDKKLEAESALFEAKIERAAARQQKIQLDEREAAVKGLEAQKIQLDEREAAVKGLEAQKTQLDAREKSLKNREDAVAGQETSQAARQASQKAQEAAWATKKAAEEADIAKKRAAAQGELDTREKGLKNREDAVAAREAVLKAYQTGLEAYAAGDLTSAKLKEDGGHALAYRPGTPEELKAKIRPAFEQVWESVRQIQQRITDRLTGVIDFVKKFDQAREAMKAVLVTSPTAEALRKGLAEPKVLDAVKVATEEEGISVEVLRAMQKGGLGR